MKSLLKKQLEQLISNGTHVLLKGAMHGIEKEGLRVDCSGVLSQKPHPEGLGSALTNSNITTDFSESQLEIITPVFEDPGTAIQFLENLHGFTYSHLGVNWFKKMGSVLLSPPPILMRRTGAMRSSCSTRERLLRWVLRPVL